MFQNTRVYYKFSLIIISALWVGGGLLQFLNLPPPDLSFPSNVIFFSLCVGIIVATGVFLKRKFVFQWMSSIQNSSVVITAFIFLCLLMAVIPQQSANDSVFANILHTYYFHFTYLFLLLTLGMVVMRRITTNLTYRNIAFLFNHIGLWIVLAAGGLGSYDFIKADMMVRYNSPVWYAFTSKNEYLELPFALELKEFNVEYYLPNVQLFKVDTQDITKSEIIKTWELDTSNTIQYKDISFRIKKYVPYTWWWNDSMIILKTPGYVGSALVQVNYMNNSIEGWISYSSVMQKGKYLTIDNKYMLLLSDPLPKTYVSKVQVYTKKGDIFSTQILVNKPLHVMGWNVYQKDFNRKFREFSDYSVFEVNRDPWLWVVYTGLIMLVVGAFMLIFLTFHK